MFYIENVDDQNKLIIRNSIKYLSDLTQARKLNVPTLKSLYRTKCRLMELRQHIFLPQQKPYKRCQQCFMDFSEGNTKFEVQPVKLSCFAKKIVAKVRNNGTLTTYQRKYYKKLEKKYPNGFCRQNKLVLTCSYCDKQTRVCMDKPKKNISKKTLTFAKKKIKTKKKDKFCGLNESVVVLSSIKNKKQDPNISNTENNNKTPLNSTKVFVAAERSNVNTSVSMTNTRAFLTSNSLKPNSRPKPTIRLRKREVAKAPNPELPGVIKSREKLQKKNLNSLSDMLKKANDNRNRSRPTTNLKDFLASL